MKDTISKEFLGVTFDGAKQNEVSIQEAQHRQAENRKNRPPQPADQNDLTGSFDHAKKLHNPRFLVSSSGYVSPVPDWATGPFPTKSEGVQFRSGSGGHGFDPRTASVRVMDENWNQGRRTVYENCARPDPQVIDPFSGKTSMVKGHFYHDKKPK